MAFLKIWNPALTSNLRFNSLSILNKPLANKVNISRNFSVLLNGHHTTSPVNSKKQLFNGPSNLQAQFGSPFRKIDRHFSSKFPYLWSSGPKTPPTEAISSATTSNEALSSATASDVPAATLPTDISSLAIPEPPAVPSGPSLEEQAQALGVDLHEFAVNALGEPTLQSLGLGFAKWYYPTGLFQELLEALHAHAGVSWWLAIMMSTLVIRSLLLPVWISARRSTINYSNAMPKVVVIQQKVLEARRSGNVLEMIAAAHEMDDLQRRNLISPAAMYRPMLIQGPVFLTVFWGIRGLTNLPVESLFTGGPSWFLDLTAYDPYYILPALTALTMLATLETGSSAQLAPHKAYQKWFLRSLPIPVFLFTMHFPAALTLYWLCSNVFTLASVAALNVPAVKQWTRMPDRELPPPSDRPRAPGFRGFKEQFKESFANAKSMTEQAERDALDEQAWRRAGSTPAPRTYSYDPTKVRAGPGAGVRPPQAPAAAPQIKRNT